MGINAQTSVPKFTSGDVLTAANANLLTNAPPVFSGTATRDAAFGGAGEKTLAEGQLCYLEDSNVVQYYDGAVWDTVGSSAGGAWTTYIPVIKGGATTVTATIAYAKYIKTGKTVILQVEANVTSAGAANGKISVSLPSAVPILTSSNMTVGSFFILDSGTAFYIGAASGDSVSNIIVGTGYGAVDNMGVSAPAMTLANGDTVSISVMYEVA